jgi:hypothetical protein
MAADPKGSLYLITTQSISASQGQIALMLMLRIVEGWALTVCSDGWQAERIVNAAFFREVARERGLSS